MNPTRGTEPKTILKLQAGFMSRSSYCLIMAISLLFHNSF